MFSLFLDTPGPFIKQTRYTNTYTPNHTPSKYCKCLLIQTLLIHGKPLSHSYTWAGPFIALLPRLITLWSVAGQAHSSAWQHTQQRRSTGSVTWVPQGQAEERTETRRTAWGGDKDGERVRERTRTEGTSEPLAQAVHAIHTVQSLWLELCLSGSPVSHLLRQHFMIFAFRCFVLRRVQHLLDEPVLKMQKPALARPV